MRPEYRGFGIVRELLAAVARIARERRCDRFQWAVLDWNVGAVAFYESLGGAVLPDWPIARVAVEAITCLAESPRRRLSGPNPREPPTWLTERERW